MTTMMMHDNQDKKQVPQQHSQLFVSSGKPCCAIILAVMADTEAAGAALWQTCCPDARFNALQ